MNAEILAAAYRSYQRSARVHPFTCGGGGGPCPGLPMDVERDAVFPCVALRCPKCGRVQRTDEWMDRVVLQVDD
jgi:hypothetical protein